MTAATSGASVARSPMQIALRKFRQHRAAVYGGIILLTLYGAMGMAEISAPYDYRTGARLKPFHPPTRIRCRLPDGSWTRPYVYDTRQVLDSDYHKHYVEVSPENLEYLRGALEEGRVPAEVRRYPLRLFPRGDSVRLLGLLPTSRHLFGIETDVRGPDRPMFYLFGSDDLGRDLLSRVIHGARVSLTIGFCAVGITFSLGLLAGGISGYYGGKTDFLLQRVVEGIMLLPGFYMLLALQASLPREMGPIVRYFAIVLILSFIGWAGLARTIRGIVLSIRQNDYVLASRALGTGRLSVLVRHILPNTFSYVIVAVTLAIPGYMLGESGLSFLGLGIPEPYASWGNMLTLSRDPSNCVNYPWVLIPGFFIFLSVVSFNLLGDGLRDAFDPRTVVRARAKG